MELKVTEPNGDTDRSVHRSVWRSGAGPDGGCRGHCRPLGPDRLGAALADRVGLYTLRLTRPPSDHAERSRTICGPCGCGRKSGTPKTQETSAWRRRGRPRLWRSPNGASLSDSDLRAVHLRPRSRLPERGRSSEGAATVGTEPVSPRTVGRSRSSPDSRRGTGNSAIS